MLELIPLGTSSAVPTRTRHLSGYVVRRDGRAILLDCGEGTQYQLIRAGVNRGRIDAVFITHLHGDHFFGLPGLLSTLALLRRSAPLTVVGPAGLGAILDALPGLTDADLTYALEVVELPETLRADVVYEAPGYTVEARPLDHRVFAAGYRIEERERPGRVAGGAARAAGVRETADFESLRRGESVRLADGAVVAPDGLVGPPRRGAALAYVLDSRPCPGGLELARRADLLVHDATFAQDMLARAVDTGHSTAREAAELARDAAARSLLLTHFSTRYADVAPLLAEARAVFPNTDVAVELTGYVVEAEPAEAPQAAGNP